MNAKATSGLIVVGIVAVLVVAWPRGPRDPALAAVGEFIADHDIDTTAPGWREALPAPPRFEFARNAHYLWHLQTSQGPITLQLWPQVAQLHVSSTVYLTVLGFYDGLTFHRVIPGFMAQAGCPRGDGLGGPGYSYDGEFYAPVNLDRPGLLAMANTGQPRSDGSQFFLTVAPAPWLNGKHTVFGEVVDGMDTLKRIEALGSAPDGKTSSPIVIERATIEVERL